jgi:hypothetical protein
MSSASLKWAASPGRYGYLAERNLSQLLADLADCAVSLADLREEFLELLEACQPT